MASAASKTQCNILVICCCCYCCCQSLTWCRATLPSFASVSIMSAAAAAAAISAVLPCSSPSNCGTHPHSTDCGTSKHSPTGTRQGLQLSRPVSSCVSGRLRSRSHVQPPPG